MKAGELLFLRQSVLAEKTEAGVSSVAAAARGAAEMMQPVAGVSCHLVTKAAARDTCTRLLYNRPPFGGGPLYTGPGPGLRFCKRRATIAAGLQSGHRNPPQPIDR